MSKCAIFFYQNNNHFNALDLLAESLWQEQALNGDYSANKLADLLQKNYQISTVFSDDKPHLLRQFDKNNRILYLSNQLDNAQRFFQLASQLALISQQKLLNQLCHATHFTDDTTLQLAKTGLANYFAGALLMPYTQFLQKACDYRYDVERLKSHFHVSTEQVCHRLSTLQRLDNKGIPFYFVRVDQAGNISKRQSATSFQFARSGGACPLWNVHEAASSPQRVAPQIAEMPGGKRYFCIAFHIEKTSHWNQPSKRFAIGLGCELEHAQQMVYADGIDLNAEQRIVPIGPGCRVCPRTNCAHRAFPPVGKSIKVDSSKQNFEPYEFE